MAKELTAFFNKQYRDSAHGGALLALQRKFIEMLCRISDGRLPSHVFYADDCFVVFRNLGFRNNLAFSSALAEAKAEPFLYARLWRLWVLAWSMQTSTRLDGMFLDCGTYDGSALDVCLRYLINSGVSLRGREVLLIDLFDNPPEEARKHGHGPLLYEQVCDRFSSFAGVSVVQGELPHALNDIEAKPVCWAQIDLNSADADASCFAALIPRLVPGAIVVFDDYGFSRYSQTQSALDALAAQSGNLILELPTGQGLLIFNSHNIKSEGKEC